MISPKQPEKIPVSVYLSHDHKEILERKAAKWGRTLSAEIRMAINVYLGWVNDMPCTCGPNEGCSSCPPSRREVVFKTLSQADLKRAVSQALRDVGLDSGEET